MPEHYAAICNICDKSLGGDRTAVGRVLGKHRWIIFGWLRIHRALLCPGPGYGPPLEELL